MEAVLHNYVNTAVIQSGETINVLGVVTADTWVYVVLELRGQLVSKLGIERIRIDELEVRCEMITAFQFMRSVNDEQTRVFGRAATGGDIPGPPGPGL